MCRWLTMTLMNLIPTNHIREELRGNVLRIFNVSEPDWINQDPNAIHDVQKLMKVDWEYEDNQSVSLKKLVSHCKKLLKREHHKLNTY